MSIHSGQLSKVLKIGYAPEPLARKLLNLDVLETLNKEKQVKDLSPPAGGDFHSPIWSVFKKHIFIKDAGDFSEVVNDLIYGNESKGTKGNRRRERLYLPLGRGLMTWWLEKRRWINEKIKPIKKKPTGSIKCNEIGSEFKINNFLAVMVGDSSHRFIYPYFSEAPALSEEAARVGLWQIHIALPSIDVSELRILDVMRGKCYSVADVPFKGNEQQLFENLCENIINRWDARYVERKAA